MLIRIQHRKQKEISLKKTSKVKKKNKCIFFNELSLLRKTYDRHFFSFSLSVQVNFNFDLWSIVFDLHNKSNHSGPLSFLKGKIFLSVILAVVSSAGCHGIWRQGPGIFINARCGAHCGTWFFFSGVYFLGGMDSCTWHYWCSAGEYSVIFLVEHDWIQNVTIFTTREVIMHHSWWGQSVLLAPRGISFSSSGNN